MNEATEEDLIQRNFTVDRPNALWLSDITEHPTREGKVYCCVVLNAFSRRVVGWAIDRRCETALVKDAVSMASDARSIGPGAGTSHISTSPKSSWPHIPALPRQLMTRLQSSRRVRDVVDAWDSQGCRRHRPRTLLTRSRPIRERTFR